MATSPSTVGGGHLAPAPAPATEAVVHAKPAATLVEETQEDILRAPTLEWGSLARGESLLCHSASFEDDSKEAVVCKAGLLKVAS